MSVFVWLLGSLLWVCFSWFGLLYHTWTQYLIHYHLQLCHTRRNIGKKIPYQLLPPYKGIIFIQLVWFIFSQSHVILLLKSPYMGVQQKLLNQILHCHLMWSIVCTIAPPLLAGLILTWSKSGSSLSLSGLLLCHTVWLQHWAPILVKLSLTDLNKLWILGNKRKWVSTIRGLSQRLDINQTSICDFAQHKHIKYWGWCAG